MTTRRIHGSQQASRKPSGNNTRVAGGALQGKPKSWNPERNNSPSMPIQRQLNTPSPVARTRGCPPSVIPDSDRGSSVSGFGHIAAPAHRTLGPHHPRLGQPRRLLQGLTGRHIRPRLHEHVPEGEDGVLAFAVLRFSVLGGGLGYRSLLRNGFLRGGLRGDIDAVDMASSLSVGLSKVKHDGQDTRRVSTARLSHRATN